MKTPKLTSIIKGAASRHDISSKYLAKVTGIPYQTLRYRFKYPQSWRFCEWAAVLRHMDFNETEISEIGKEMKRL